jgi:uncharacterized protein (DUF2235 family)
MPFSQQSEHEGVARGRVRRILMCADGTCNAFGRNESNVARLLRHVRLGPFDGCEQVASYDQGLGTQLFQHRQSLRFQSMCSQGAFDVLDPPKESIWLPWTIRDWLKAMTLGKGLSDNVRQLYVALAQRYAVGSEVYFFGFSRGAFTVRALAALTWRYGLPVNNDRVEALERFSKYWPLLEEEYRRGVDENGSVVIEPQLERGMRECRIRFLGLWDTVKSYGGLEPRLLPHLRHNPSIAFVRHAMALDDCRAWFEPTTWGWLDSDRRKCPETYCGRIARPMEPCSKNGCEYKNGSPIGRLGLGIIERLDKQDVAEVWFKGSHADVGGSNKNTATSDIALRWMMGEAKAVGLRLNADGDKLMSEGSEAERPKFKDARGLFWKCVDRIRRHTIRNDGLWPKLVSADPGPVPREPAKSMRRNKVLVHESAIAYFHLKFARNLPVGVQVESAPTIRR